MGNAQIRHITVHGKMRSLQDLKKTEGWKISEWEYLQLKHLVNTLPQPTRDGKDLNPLEKLCCTQPPLKHGISKVYEILTYLEGQKTPPYIGKS